MTDSTLVIKIRNRYYCGISKGRLITAHSLAGAKHFLPFLYSFEIDKAISFIKYKGQKYQVLKVGIIPFGNEKEVLNEN